MKVLVLGASGMAGHTISCYFKEQGHETHGLGTTPVDFLDTVFVCDAMDKSRFTELLRQGNYDCVINCIGLLNRAADRNKARAIYLNSYLPHFIAEILRDTRTMLIHMSTDCVFSGEKGDYSEIDYKDGRTLYDRSKALGEVDDGKNLTFRSSIIGPDMKEEGIGLFNWFMKQEGELYGFRKAFWTGVTTLTLAKAMEQAAEQKLTGIYNLVNNIKISKFDMLCLFNKHMKGSRLKIVPSEETVADKSLVNTRKDFSFTVPKYEDMIIEMKEWIKAHKAYYPHYFPED